MGPVQDIAAGSNIMQYRLVADACIRVCVYNMLPNLLCRRAGGKRIIQFSQVFVIGCAFYGKAVAACVELSQDVVRNL